NMTITGSGFTGVTAIKFTNNVAATFTVNSNTQITATVPAGAVTGPITISKTGCPDVQTATFTITIPNPVPTVTCLNPNMAIVGGQAFTLTVNGTNFVNGSMVIWDGSPRTTTFVSRTEVRA